VLQRRLERRNLYLALYATMMLIAIGTGIATIVTTRATSRAMLASMQPSPALLNTMGTFPAQRIYIQTLSDFYLNTYYATHPLLQNRFSLLYTEPAEVAILGHNTNAVTAVNMQHFTNLSIVPYNEFLGQQVPLLLHYDNSWEWVKKDLDNRNIPLQPLGDALRGELLRVEPAPR
jgi:hypothetical protein